MGFSRTGNANGAPGHPGGLADAQMAQTRTDVPPQNLEAEASVLGAMMVSEGAIAPVILDVRLRDEDFYRERHRIVFRAVKALYERSEPVDALTVTELLTQQGELAEAGGKDVVSEFASTVPAPGNARHYAQIVKQNSLLRRLLETSQRIQMSVHDREGEPEELVERAESMLFKVAHEERASDFRLVADVLAEEIDRLEALAKGDRDVTGTPSGFRDLDNLLGGFQPGNLIVLAARPSLGKSALVCNIAENVATKAKLPVAFFSLEMSEAELAHRFIGCRSRIPSDRLRKGKVAARDWPRVVRACNELEEAPLWLDDSSDLSLLELRAKARRLAAEPGRPRPRDRRLHAADAARGPASEPRRAGRPGEPRPEDPRPRAEPAGDRRLAALPGTGAAARQATDPLRPSRKRFSIEQDADVVSFIYRASKYDEDADPSEADLIIAKHRNGPTGDVPVVFLEQYPRFVDKAGGAERPVEQKAGEGPPLIDLAEEA